MPAHLLLLRLARRRGAQQVSATAASTVKAAAAAATATAQLATATAATAVAAAMVPYHSLLHPLNLPSRYRPLANPPLAFEP